MKNKRKNIHGDPLLGDSLFFLWVLPLGSQGFVNTEELPRKDRCKAADIQSVQSNPFILHGTQRPAPVSRPSVGSAPLLCTLRDYLLVFTPDSFQSLVGGDVFIPVAVYLVHLLFSLLLTDIDSKCLNCDQLICFRQKLAYLEESEQWTAFFKLISFISVKA